MYNDRQQTYILINMLETSIGRKNQLVDKLDGIQNVAQNLSHYSALIRSIVDEKIYNELLRLVESGALQKEIEAADKLSVTIITKCDEEYPEKLLEIALPPVVLYCLGDTSLLKADKLLAIIGTRTPSRYGVEVTETFASELSMNDFIIISGMARGIDAVAHRACMKNKKPTIAILGSGVDIVYPADNFAIYEYAKQCGLIISEYSLKSEALKYHFPERNRIISGLSDGLLVTEAGEKSGSLITLNYAIEQGKQIFIVPSNITNKYAKGTNKAIKEMPCSCVTDVNDIYDAFNMQPKVEDKKIAGLQLDIIEQIIVTALEVGELHFEDLLSITSLKVDALTAMLSKMELFGIVKKIGGNYYSL